MHAKPARPRKRARASTRRKTVRWSNREVDALLAGVRTYGVGKWARILRHSPVFNGVRTSVDLKDKWRNLTSPVRAAALAPDAPPSPHAPHAPPPEHPPPPTSPRSHSTSEQAADAHVSTPQPESPKPQPTPVSESSPVASHLPAVESSPSLPATAYPPITPYSVSQTIYHSAAAFAADYWRRFSHDAMYGVGSFSSIFPYVKHTPLLHPDEDDDDDDDDDHHHPHRFMHHPVYNPYNLAMTHMLGTLDPNLFAHAFPPHTPTSTIPTEPHPSEAHSLQPDHIEPDMDDNLSAAHTAPPPTTDPAQSHVAETNSPSCSTPNVHPSDLSQEQLPTPMQSA